MFVAVYKCAVLHAQEGMPQWKLSLPGAWQHGVPTAVGLPRTLPDWDRHPPYGQEAGSETGSATWSLKTKASRGRDTSKGTELHLPSGTRMLATARPSTHA